MRLTDMFILRPVLAVVVSVFILLVGVRSEQSLPVREFPKTVHALIQVETSYYGADANTVAGFITTPIENAIAQVDGIDYLTSTSMTGDSTITAHLRLNQDPDRVLTEMQTQISAVHNQLPTQSQAPSVNLMTGAEGGMLILAYTSDIMSPEQITDYLTRVVQPQLQSIQGVQKALVWGAQNFAVRAWLDPDKLAAHGLTAADVSNQMTANNFTTGAGATAGQMTQRPLGITTGVHTLPEFRDLVVKQANGAITRLGDVAKVELGSDNYQQSFLFDGRPSVLIDVEPVPDANVLELTKRVRNRLDAMQADLPQGLRAFVAKDVTTHVQASINEVAKTLLESLAIVAIVVFAFLRSARASLIPVITIPLSLIGTFAILYMFGFSINLLTLLALVLATGLVVDDAIIVVENVSREMAEGATALDAAMRSARGLAGPIIAMTVVLIAVYVPIALRSGLTGALFREFALTLVGSVTVSAVLALSLSPMMCRFLLRGAARPQRRPALNGMQRFYRPCLRVALNFSPIFVALGIAVFAGSYFLYVGSTSELAPQEDTGFILMAGSVSPTASIDQLRLYDRQITQIEQSLPEFERSYQNDQPGQSGGGFALKDFGQRKRSTTEVLSEVQAKVGDIAGENLAAFLEPSLPGSFGDLPVGYVIKTTRPFSELDVVSSRFLDEAKKTGLFDYVDRDLKIDLPQSTVVIDRNKVAALGLDVTQVGNVLNTLLSGGYVNYFDMAGRSYKVIPEVSRSPTDSTPIS